MAEWFWNYKKFSRCSRFNPKKFIPLKFDVLGELDCLINNAGIAIRGPSIILKTNDFRHQFEVNLFGVILVTNALIDLLCTNLNNNYNGKIINISSVSGRAFPFVAPYTASKFALEGYLDALRRELLLYGIDVI